MRKFLSGAGKVVGWGQACEEGVDGSVVIRPLLLPPARRIQEVALARIGVNQVALGVVQFEVQVRRRGASRTAYDTEHFTPFDGSAYRFFCKRSPFQVSIPGDRSVLVLYIDGIPGSPERATPVGVAILFQHNPARSRR